jgi:malto-oligosyltrehalose trehalohydrolase
LERSFVYSVDGEMLVPASQPKGDDDPNENRARRAHRLAFGAEVRQDGVLFRLWAPLQKEVRLKIEGCAAPRQMQARENGWHELFAADAAAGALYQFILADGLVCPDPASRFQPLDVHGPSEVIDPRAYRWTHPEWRGRPWEECVLYELHVGAFTAAGTFLGAAGRLDRLAELGITAIELMPIGDFSGDRNWGYDGVLPFAPDSSYGRPEDLKALIDAAHARGVMVFLDVVYNHFGPDGNYLPSYAPVLTDKHTTPWGAAVNFDATGSETVREFVVQNAIYWIEEYHLDGLRLDAVHAMLDDSPRHILEDIASRVRAAAGDREVHLILENEENDAFRLGRDASRRPRQFTAQCNDDIHHGLHAAASKENDAYYGEYAGNTELLGRALAEGFSFQGQLMAYRGRHRGEPSAALPPTAFVSFIQNHDQIGNRAFGDRITEFAPFEAVRAIAAIYLLAPQIPMLFMGEEWAARQPFPFFCDYGSELAEAVKKGRQEEFARFPQFRDPANREKLPDPTTRATFLFAKLRWEDATDGVHAQWRDWYRRVIAVRHAEIIPRLAGIAGNSARWEIVEDMTVLVRWTMGDGAQLVLAANLKETATQSVDLPPGRPLWSEGSIREGQLGPWSTIWILLADDWRR